VKDIVVSLFDLTGVMVKPWLRAGYTAWIVDTQHPLALETGGVTREGVRLRKVHWDLKTPWLPSFDRERIAFVSAFPPCDHLAISGSRWFTNKGLRPLAHSLELFATAIEFCEWVGEPFLIENPVSTISTYWRSPDHVFDPHQFTGYEADDNYTKRTCLWTGGGFKMPAEFKEEGLPPPDQRILNSPDSNLRSFRRSATPAGFAEAVFRANGRKFPPPVPR